MTIKDPGGWTSAQLDAIDQIFGELRVELAVVETCLQSLEHYGGINCDEITGVRRILQRVLSQATDTTEGWWDSRREERAKLEQGSHSSAVPEPELVEPVKRETKAAKAAIEKKGFRGPRRVIEPALGVLDQAKDAELRDLRDMVEFTLDLEGLFRIFGADFPATVTLDPSQVLQFYEEDNPFREAIDLNRCDVAAVDLIDVSATFSGM